MDQRIATARAKGSVGKGALVPNFLAERVNLFLEGKRVLDFGSGPLAIHKPLLESKGMIVDCYDLAQTEHNISRAEMMSISYDAIMLSNVINVQRSLEELHALLEDIWFLKEEKTKLYFNIPSSPRYLPWDTKQYLSYMQDYFFPKVISRTKFRSGWIYCV